MNLTCHRAQIVAITTERKEDKNITNLTTGKATNTRKYNFTKTINTANFGTIAKKKTIRSKLPA